MFIYMSNADSNVDQCTLEFIISFCYNESNIIDVMYVSD